MTKLLLLFIALQCTGVYAMDSSSTNKPPRPEYQDYFNVSGPFEGPIDVLHKEDPFYVKSFIRGGVPRAPLMMALDYYFKNYFMFNNKDYMTLIDFTVHSIEQRMFVLNINTGQVNRYLVSHGSGGDVDHDGHVDVGGFGNISESKKSSLGAYIVTGEYSGKYGRSTRLVGLEFSNSNAFARDIVLHPANYATPEAIDENELETGKRVLGRSSGCPSVDYRYRDEILDWIGGEEFSLHIWWPKKSGPISFLVTINRNPRMFLQKTCWGRMN